MSILLTGFEAFGNYTVNPTELLVHEYHGRSIGGVNIEGRVIKLEFHSIRDQIQQAIEEVNPQVIILTGQAPRPSISLEKIAINYVHTGKTAYNCGTKIQHQLLDPNGKTAYFSTLPLIRINNALHDEGIPSKITYSAGTFGCNQVFYETMRYLDLHGKSSVRSGFVHIPLLPEQAIHGNNAFMNLDMMIKAMKIIIKETLEEV